jgi:hypothetical protein
MVKAEKEVKELFGLLGIAATRRLSAGIGAPDVWLPGKRALVIFLDANIMISYRVGTIS